MEGSGGFGSSEGASRTYGGGLSSIGHNPIECFIWNEAYDDGATNFFEYIY